MTETQFTILIVLLSLVLVGLISLVIIYLYNKDKSDAGLNPKLEAKIDNLQQQNMQQLQLATEKNGELKEHLANVVASNNRKITEDFIAFSDKMVSTLNEQVDKINKRVDEKLGAGFEQTNKTFSDVVERLTRIDAAQKQIEKLSTDVVSLNEILTDKKNRGTFGEVQLKQVFVSVFGENKPDIYELQKKLPNESIADSVLHAPEPMGDICIDSKFPLENYRRMLDKGLTEKERNDAEKQFKLDVKKHVDDISSKYIIPAVTSDQAIMFLPAEAIFAEINARHEDLIMYGQTKRVWFASPTTLMSTLTVVQMILKDIQRNKFSRVIQDELNKLSQDFDRFEERWDKLLKNLNTVSKQADQVSKSSSKITKRFKVISNVEELNPIEEDNLIIDSEDEDPLIE